MFKLILTIMKVACNYRLAFPSPALRALGLRLISSPLLFPPSVSLGLLSIPP